MAAFDDVVEIVEECAAAAAALSAEEHAFESADDSFQTWSPDLVYGELLESTFLPILRRAAAQTSDIGSGGASGEDGFPRFLDVGSGKGRIVAVAALSGIVSLSVGVELVPRLHREGCRLLRALSARDAPGGDVAGDPQRKTLCSLVCADMFDDAPSAFFASLSSVKSEETHDAEGPRLPITSLCYTRQLSTLGASTAHGKERVEAAAGSETGGHSHGHATAGFDIVLVNGLCFEEDTLDSCLKMLLCGGKSGGDKGATTNAHWHVFPDGGLLLLTSVELPRKFLDGSAGSKVALVWEEECKGTSWGRPVMVRAYQRS